jgi:hypothetical protein
MFAKSGRFRGLDRRRAPPSKAVACNDNHPASHAAAISQRPLRRRLVCGWRQMPATGRLECFWHLVPQVVQIDSPAAEEPGISWLVARLRSLPGVCITAKLPFGAIVVTLVS